MPSERTAFRKGWEEGGQRKEPREKKNGGKKVQISDGILIG